MRAATVRCGNDNHRRAVVRVRFCAGCGETLNAAIPAVRCPEAEHAKMRRGMSAFCVDCGDRLIAAR